MNEIPERIEREMFEIRSRMAPDVRDLKQHVAPQAVKNRIVGRIKARINGVKDRITGAGKNLVASAKGQANMVGEAGRKRNPGPLTDAVKSDPKPLVVLAVSLLVTLLMVRKIFNGRGDD